MKKVLLVVSIIIVLVIGLSLCACSAEDFAHAFIEEYEKTNPPPEKKQSDATPEGEETPEDGEDVDGDNQGEDGDEEGDGEDSGEFVPMTIEDNTNYGAQNKSLTKEQFWAAFDYATNFKNFVVTKTCTIQSPGADNTILRTSDVSKFVIHETEYMYYSQDEEGNYFASEYVCIKNGQLLMYQLTYADDSTDLVWQEECEPQDTEETVLRAMIPTLVGTLIDCTNYPDDEESIYRYENFRYDEGSKIYTTNKSTYEQGASEVMTQLSFDANKLVWANELRVSIWDMDNIKEVVYFQNEYSVQYNNVEIVIPAELEALLNA